MSNETKTDEATGTKEVTIPEIITVRELADLLEVSPIQLIKTLMSNGILASINQQIDFDTAALLRTKIDYMQNIVTNLYADPKWQKVAEYSPEV